MKGENVRRFAPVLLFLVALSVVNVAFAPVTVPLIHVDPEANTGNPGDEVTVTVSVEDVVDLYGYEIKMGFDLNFLQVAYHWEAGEKIYHFEEGAFLQQTESPYGTFFSLTPKLGYIHVSQIVLGAYPGVSGSGVLFSVNFTVFDTGKCTLDLYEAQPVDSGGNAFTVDLGDGYFYTDLADLVRKSAWPEHHHYVVGKDEDPNQTLSAKVKNLAPVDLHAKVTFDLMRDDGFSVTVTTEEVVITPGTIVTLTANFGPLDGSYAGKYYASAKTSCSYSGIYWTEGQKNKTFSFAIV